MKLTANKSAAFVEKPDSSLRVFLLYGPDAGLVRERAQKLCLKFVPDIHDPFSVSELSGNSLEENASRLHDEMSSISMMGGRRLVRLRDAGDGSAFGAIDHLLSNLPGGDSIAVLEAGELDKRSKLRNRIEDDAKAMAIPCYAEEGAALTDTIAAMIKAEGFQIDRDALAALSATLPPDRSGIRMEVDKLITYAMAPARAIVPSSDGTERMASQQVPEKRITTDHVAACITDAAGEEVDDAVWAAASGDMVKLDAMLAKLNAEGVQPIQFLRAATRHLTRIYEGLGKMQEEGLGAMETVKSMRPPIFFKREAQMQKQLRSWTLGKVMDAMCALLEAEMKCKTSGMPAERLGERALYNVARLGK
ncbi:MAG: DNA polymerase III subunit delta [Alphaproteobacteria bacterium]|nr:DNA polymerase III subunit delta [Alphaproteobacteria bacterium]